MERPPPPGPPSGRRDNGLPSADWGALVDLDPRLSEALLTSLASADVPAFVEPAAGSVAWTRAVQLPDRPLHRLWVDPSKADTAREVVAAEVADLSALLAEHDPGATAHGFVQAVPRTAAVRVLPPPRLPELPQRRSDEAVEPPTAPPPVAGPAAAEPARAADGPAAEPDEDEVWRQIVAGFGKEVDAPVPPWPVVEDVDPPRRPTLPARPDRPDRPDRDAPRRRRTDPPPPALPDWVEPEAVEDDGHYVPPPPPPVPRLAPRKLAAAATLVVGLLLMLSPGALLQPSTTGVNVVGVLLTVAGGAALVWLMRDARPPDSGPDDGAVV